MIMKIHSYMATNGYLQTVRDKHVHTLKELHEVVEHAQEKSIGDNWENALDEARSRIPEVCLSQDGSDESRSLDGTPSLTPEPDGTTRTLIDGDVAAALRKHIAVAPGETEAKPVLGLGVNAIAKANNENGTPAELIARVDAEKPEPDYAVLVHHPNEDIKSLAQELLDLDSELTSTGINQVRWPENITYRNFADYQLIPTLVYELEYPRTDKSVSSYCLDFVNLR